MRNAWLIALASAALSCSTSTDGPTPQVSGVSPEVICTAQADQTITITGSGMSPVVVDGLTDSPAVEMPRVILIGDSGQTEIPAANVALPEGDTSGTMLEVVIPTGLVSPTGAGEAEAVYDILVINPNGNEGSLTGGLTVVPPPSLAAVAPTSGAQGTQEVVTLTGTGFRDGMTVTLDAVPAVTGTDVTVTSPTSATAVFDLTNVAAGTYSITVTNADGCAATLEAAFTVYVPRTLELVGIDPPFGCTCDDTAVTITTNGGLVSTPRVEMRPTGQDSPVITFEQVAFIDENTITAVVPAGAALGDYDVTVINPPSDGGIGTLESAFRVVEQPVPSIEAIIPSRGDPVADQDVSIYGENFRDPVKIELLDRLGNIVATVDSVTPALATRIDVTLPITGLLEDAYLVRVTNLDENTYSTFSSFIVASLGPSGNLHPFEAEGELNTGRRMLAGVSARDEVGNRFLYAIGGDTGDGGDVLASVEVSQLSKFGDLGAWLPVRNALNTPRVGAAVVRVPIYDDAVSAFVPVKTYLYVLGGMSDAGTVLDSVERAVVLSPNDAPRITSIAKSATDGTLEAGTWYYKVSAVLAAADPDNPGGETLPSDEAIITIGGTGGAIDLSWDPVTVNGMPAASYRIYRTDAVNGISQTEHLIATVDGTSYTDTGDAAGTESPLPPGSTGVWVTEAGTLGAARWGHQAAVVTDTNGDSFVYAVGGKSDATTGYLASVEYAPIDATTGALGAFVTDAATALPEGRAFFSLTVESPENVSGYTGDGRLIVLGGVVGGAATEDFLISDVVAGGGNGGWSGYAGASTILVRAGPMAVITSEKLFVLGGAGAATDTTFSNILAGARDVGFLADGSLASPIQDAAITLTPARALGAAISGSGFIYLVGGTSDGTDALTSTEKTF